MPAGAEAGPRADGAFVPLVGGEWAEVKPLVLAEMMQNKRGGLHPAASVLFSYEYSGDLWEVGSGGNASTWAEKRHRCVPSSIDPSGCKGV